MALSTRPTGPAGIHHLTTRCALLLLPLLLTTPFATSVAAVNHAPAILGNPATAARVGKWYAFTPGAYDADGNQLTFEAVRMPPWATFDPRTGRLTGVPPTSATGRHEDIVIGVTDGKVTRRLRPFTIVVTDPAVLGSATLHWRVPTERTNGMPVQDIDGYRVRYGRNARHLDKFMLVENPGMTSIVIENLEAGQWYFALSAFTRDGDESPASNIVSKIIG